MAAECAGSGPGGGARRRGIESPHAETVRKLLEEQQGDDKPK